jgi:hypothetical protein
MKARRSILAAAAEVKDGNRLKGLKRLNKIVRGLEPGSKVSIHLAMAAVPAVVAAFNGLSHEQRVEVLIEFAEKYPEQFREVLRAAMEKT